MGFSFKKAWVLGAVLCLLSLVACKEAANPGQTNSTLRRLEVGGREFYVPEAYFSASYTIADPSGMLIQAWYPGDKTIPGKPNDLWKKGIWSKNVRILIQRYPKPDMKRLLEGMIDQVTHATQLVGPEYGLTHWTQSQGQVQDNQDVWIEESGGSPVSFLTCREMASVAQCSHYVDVLPFSLKISYDMKLLPEWKKIEAHVLSLYDSFKTPETAAAYFKKNNTNKLDKEIIDDDAEHHKPQ